MDVRKIAAEIAEALAEQGITRDAGVWLPTFDTKAVQVVSADPWPICVLVTMWEENERGERRYVGSRTYSPPKEGAD